MKKNTINKIALFEGSQIRRGNLNGEWGYSVVDVIQILTDSDRPRKYWDDLKRKLKEEGSQLSEKIGQLKLIASDGKMRTTDVLSTKDILRLIQSVPSPKAEPFKQWLAQVGKERLDEIEQPELAIERAKGYFYKKGHEKSWVETRTSSIDTRNQLTDSIKDKGVNNPKDYAILTNEIYTSTFGLSSSEYKKLKGIEKSDSLRNNMTNMELVATMFSEATATMLLDNSEEEGFNETKKTISKAGSITKEAIKKIEEETKQKVVSKSNFKHLDTPKKRKEIIQEETNELSSFDSKIQKALDYNPNEDLDDPKYRKKRE